MFRRRCLAGAAPSKCHGGCPAITTYSRVTPVMQGWKAHRGVWQPRENMQGSKQGRQDGAPQQLHICSSAIMHAGHRCAVPLTLYYSAHDVQV